MAIHCRAAKNSLRGTIVVNLWPRNIARISLRHRDLICTWTCLHYRVICCTWTCQQIRVLNSTWTCLDKRSLCCPPPPSKIHENWKENSIQIILDRKMLLPLSRKIQAMTHPLSCFFAAEGPWFNLGAYWVVKPLNCVFYYLKGRGPLKKSNKIAEM